MTDQEIIDGIASGATSIRQQIEPILKGVRDVTFDDVYQEACMILMENVKAGKLDTERELNLGGYLYVICKRIALRFAARRLYICLRKIKEMSSPPENDSFRQDRAWRSAEAGMPPDKFLVSFQRERLEERQK